MKKMPTQQPFPRSPSFLKKKRKKKKAAETHLEIGRYPPNSLHVKESRIDKGCLRLARSQTSKIQYFVNNTFCNLAWY